MKNKIWLPLVTALLALSVLFGVGVYVGEPGTADAQIGSGIGNFDIQGPVIVKTDVQINDQLTVIGATSLQGDTVFTDQAAFETDIYSTAQSTATLTSGGTLTPSSNYVRISAAGNVGLSTIDGCTAGASYSKILHIINMANVTITFTDTSSLKLSGNAALGQYDSLVLRCDNGHGNWIQMAKTDN